MQYIGRVTKKKQSSSTKLKSLYKPELHHKRAIKNIIANKHYGLLLAPGRGKTGIILEAFKRLKEANEIDVLIVIAKLRITKQTWPKEILKWDFPYGYHIAHGSKKSLEGHDVILTNYESLRWIEKELKRTRLYKKKRIMLVLDESTKIKNTSTIRFKVVRRIADMFDRRYILTGSPAPNGLKDIFGQIYFLDQGKSLGRYVTHFLAMYFFSLVHRTKKGQEYTEYGLMPGMEEEIYNKIDHLVMRLGESDKLPALTKVNRMIELSEQDRFHYDELEEELITEMESGVITASNAGVKSMKLRQVCGGFVYGEIKGQVIKVHEAKLDELEEIYEELQGSPCLVSYEFNHERDAILKRFPDSVYFAGGDEGVDIENRWNRGEIQMLIGQTSSIAHGLNLQESGYHLIMYTITWNLEDYEQIIKRLWREGQKNPVIVIHLMIENSIDEAVLMAVNSKDKTQRALLDALESRYLERELMADENIVKIFKEHLDEYGYIMPNYCKKDQGGSFVNNIMFILGDMGHNRLQDFLVDATKEHKWGLNQTLVDLYEKSLMLLTDAFDIEEPKQNVFIAYNDKLIRKYCNKVVRTVSEVSKTPEYLSLRKKAISGNKEDSKMSVSKFAKKKTATKKSTAKKSTAKKSTAKKPVVKKSVDNKPVSTKSATRGNKDFSVLKITSVANPKTSRAGIVADVINTATKAPTKFDTFVKKVMKKSGCDQKKVEHYVKACIKIDRIKAA